MGVAAFKRCGAERIARTASTASSQASVASSQASVASSKDVGASTDTVDGTDKCLTGDCDTIYRNVNCFPTYNRNTVCI